MILATLFLIRSFKPIFEKSKNFWEYDFFITGCILLLNLMADISIFIAIISFIKYLKYL